MNAKKAAIYFTLVPSIAMGSLISTTGTSDKISYIDWLSSPNSTYIETIHDPKNLNINDKITVNYDLYGYVGDRKYNIVGSYNQQVYEIFNHGYNFKLIDGAFIVKDEGIVIAKGVLLNNGFISGLFDIGIGTLGVSMWNGQLTYINPDYFIDYDPTNESLQMNFFNSYYSPYDQEGYFSDGSSSFIKSSVNNVPEPGILLLMSIGLLSVWGVSRSKR